MLRIAFEFKIDPREVQRWSRRLVNFTIEWLDARWNQPDRTDHYLMQVAAMIVGGKSLSSFKIPFTLSKPQKSEDKGALSKMVHLAHLGINLKDEDEQRD